MSAYQRVVDDDPQAFIDMRRHLENWFPKLRHVATSSIGAAIGPYIAAYHVTPQQLTRAYLSSNGMKPESLGARVIESKHTGEYMLGVHTRSRRLTNTTRPVVAQVGGASHARRCTSSSRATRPPAG